MRSGAGTRSMIEQAGIADDGDAWLDEAGAAAFAALEAAGRGVRGRALPRRAHAAREVPLRRGHDVGGQPEHDQLGAVPARRRGTDRARPPAWQLDGQPVELGTRIVVASARRSVSSSRMRRVPSWRAAGCGAYGPATVADLKWWSGWSLTQTRAPHSQQSARSRSTSTAQPGVVLPDDTEATPAAEPLGSACCPRSTRRSWAGRSGRGTSAITSAPLFDTQRQRRTDGLVGRADHRRLDSAARRRDRLPPARGRRRRRDARRSRPRPRRSRAGSASCASRPASPRRSTASSPREGDPRVAARLRGPGLARPSSPSPSAGRSPWRSRAAGSATCPRRSGTASRHASASRPGTP